MMIMKRFITGQPFFVIRGWLCQNYGIMLRHLNCWQMVCSLKYKHNSQLFTQILQIGRHFFSKLTLIFMLRRLQCLIWMAGNYFRINPTFKCFYFRLILSIVLKAHTRPFDFGIFVKLFYERFPFKMNIDFSTVNLLICRWRWLL